MTEAKNKAAIRRAHYAIRAICCFILAGCVYVAATQIDYTAIIDRASSIGYEAPSELSAIINDLELTDTGERILMATRPELQTADSFNDSCPNGDEYYYVLGCYSNNHIYVYDVRHNDLPGIRQATLAHELLHAVWSRMSDGERNDLNASLDVLYQANSELREHLELYSSDSFYDELHSIVGAQIDNKQMEEKLARHYAKYFKNQSKIALFFNDYNDRFKAINERLEELEKSIVKKRAEYEQSLAAYEAANVQLGKDIEEFNRNVATTAITDIAAFNAERQKLVDRQNQLQHDYYELNNLIESLNQDINEYNANVMRTREYAEKMNSHISKPTAGITE